MKHVNSFALAFLAVAGLADAARTQSAGGERNVVTIALAPQAVLDETVIYLDQIAELSGGPISLRQRLARLDVAEFKLSSDQTVVSSDQVRFRLMLAGIGAAQFQFSGAKRTMVQANDEPISARKILAVADQAVRSRYPNAGTPKEIITPSLQLRPSDQVELEAKAPIATPRTGSARVDVLILVNGKATGAVPVTFELNAKAPGSKTAFGSESRFGPRMDSPTAKDEVLIKSRDLVRIIANVGAAQIVATGEAQQDGKLGETIRVRNVESNRTVSGRIEARDVVLVEY